MKIEHPNDIIVSMVKDLYGHAGNGELQIECGLSIRRMGQDNPYCISIFLSPKKFGTVRKEPTEVFTIEYTEHEKPKVIRCRPGQWMNKLAMWHSSEMRIKAYSDERERAAALRESQESLAEELSAFLPIDDSFLSEETPPGETE